MLGKITKTAVERLEPGGEWHWDSVVKGFGARRQTDGVFYYVRYRLNGRQHIKSLGRHGSPLTPDTARNSAKAKLGIVMFIIYVLIYAGFIIINVASPKTMGVILFAGLNVAVVYGFGLIILAVVMGLIYNKLCTNKEDELN